MSQNKRKQKHRRWMNLSIQEDLIRHEIKLNNLQMEQNSQPSMLSTKQFIRRKCTKDHFNSVLNSANKYSSVYTSDYNHQSRKHLKNLDFNIDLARQRNSPIKNNCQYIAPLSSVYMRSFEKNQMPAPERFHEKRGYFLKTQNYQPIQSTYNKSLVINENKIPAFQLQKGRPLMDNLSVAKYNKMTTKSLYRDSYEDYTKLPSVYIKRNEPRRKTNLRISCYNQIQNLKKQK